MAEPDFIFQGPTARTHIEKIRQYLTFPDVERIIINVAFVNEEGVRLLEDDLRPFANQTVIYSGIRNEITSIQGLDRLLQLGATLYVVDTGARSVVFHPKVYLVKARERAGIITGSANLTLGGLNNNIEASLALETDLTNQADRDFTEQIEAQLTNLPTQYPDNVNRIADSAALVTLREDGLLHDESEVLPPRPITQKDSPDRDVVPRIHLAPTMAQRVIRRMRTRTTAVTPVRDVGIISRTTNISTNLELLWESKPLTERDLNIPSGTNTNPTGSINLDKGKLDTEIDHRHYFRDEVFNHLTWVPREGTTEETHANFELVIKGISYGEFDLSIRHNTDTTRTTYQQHNAMTRLSWGDMREFIANRNLIGRSLAIYRDVTNPERFVIEID